MKTKKIMIYILEFMLLSLCIAFLYLITVNFIVRPVQVKGNSMHPTLKDGELAFTNIFSTFFTEPKRFDIVIVKADENRDLVKRVIALPKETIEVKNNVLYINGKKEDQSFLSKDIITKDFEKVTLKEDEYFVMGDNREHSNDSRAIGPFQRNQILSRHMYIYYPFNEMRILK